MPIRDNVSDQVVEVAGINLALDGNETNAGAIVDTAEFDLGVFFACLITAWTDGSHTLLIEEGDESDLSDAATVGTTKLIGALPVFGAIHANGDSIACVGVHSTKRYVRASFVSTGVTDGAVGSILAVKSGEYLKTDSTS